ncbi:MAG TPA: D-arabinono-1,4-lactone oxidase [Actinomycetes bacterium]|nr:D-arabinono-1,4-lactone oxidase [Actinomycetes bacterium]
MTDRTTNWAGNLTYRARRVHRPTSLDELRGTVASSDRIRALGTRHSFSAVADTTGDLVDMTGLPTTAELDRDRRQVRVSGGTRYGFLAAYLHDHGFALHNLGSLPHISVAGACATATHGSGDRNGNLATAVSALELVTATGDVVSLDRGSPDFAGAVVSLGALGVVTQLTLDVEPAYDVEQYVYDRLPAESLRAHLDEIFAAAYSVSVFTTWRHEHLDQVWLKRRTGHHVPPVTWHGATLADGPRHPLPGMPATFCTEQGGVPGPWHQRLPHFRLEFTPSAGDELQSEYLVPRQHAVAALDAVAGLRRQVAGVVQVCEVRTVASDELWLSPSFGRDSVGIHFTWRPDLPAVMPVLAALDDALAPFDPRPHWGKLFTTDPGTLRARYPRADDFVRLAHRYDPDGTFRNDFLDTYLPSA